MAKRVLPNLGLMGAFTDGENDWGADMDATLLKLSVLTQAGAKSRLAAVPGSPAQGDVHVLTGGANENAVAVYDGGAWTYYPPSEGWKVFDQGANEYIMFDGSAWVVFQAGSGGGGGEGSVGSGFVWVRGPEVHADFVGTLAVATGAHVGAAQSSMGASLIDSFYWSNDVANGVVNFDMIEPVILTGIGFVQNTPSSQGNWQASGSNDNATFTDLGNPGEWGGALYSSVSFSNTTAYRYYRLTQVSGLTIDDPYQQLFMFKKPIAASGGGGGGSVGDGAAYIGIEDKFPNSNNTSYSDAHATTGIHFQCNEDCVIAGIYAAGQWLAGRTVVAEVYEVNPANGAFIELVKAGDPVTFAVDVTAWRLYVIGRTTLEAGKHYAHVLRRTDGTGTSPTGFQFFSGQSTYNVAPLTMSGTIGWATTDVPAANAVPVNFGNSNPVYSMGVLVIVAI